jgi:uncharacterized RDD family membrane protein YckC
MLIHIKRNAEVFGPYSVEEAREYFSSGRLVLSDFAQLPGTTEWIPLASVPGVRSAPPPPPPPGPVEPPPMAPAAIQSAPQRVLPLADTVRPIKYAGFWIRFAGGFVDYIILILPEFLFTANPVIIYLWHGSGHATTQADIDAANIIGPVLSILFWWIYCSVLLSCPWQATLGMKACGLKIVDHSGKCISFGRATGRYFAEVLSALFCLIGYLMIAWTSKKQGLHDLIAGTFVVKS